MTVDVMREIAADVVARQPTGIVAQDADGAIVGHNDAALRLLGLTADQLKGRTSLDPRWAATDVHGDPLDGADHPAMRVLRTGRRVDDFVMCVQDGRHAARWLSVSSWPAEPGGIARVVTQFHDITAEIESRRRTAEALDRLQHHALPSRFSPPDWLSIETRYQSVTAPLDIGGDFFDVFDIGDGRIGFFIGDACGHHLETIATMTIARHTLRAAGLHLNRPARVLRWLDDTLKAATDTVYCSALFGVAFRDDEGSVHLRLANAGHPAPIRVSAGEAVVERGNGAVLGIIERFVEPPEVELTLAPGDELVLYTDGLLDSLRPRLVEADLVARLHAGRSDALAAIEVIDGLMRSTPTGPGSKADDTAVLVLTASAG